MNSRINASLSTFIEWFPLSLQRVLVADVGRAVRMTNGYVHCVLECGDNPAEAGAAPLFLTSQKRRRSEYRLPPHSK